LVCARRPVDPHHVRFAQGRALGRKVSDEFTVPLCRSHHRELHRSGDEYLWWENRGLDPLKLARKLWKKTRATRAPKLAERRHGARGLVALGGAAATPDGTHSPLATAQRPAADASVRGRTAEAIARDHVQAMGGKPGECAKEHRSAHRRGQAPLAAQ